LHGPLAALGLGFLGVYDLLNSLDHGVQDCHVFLALLSGLYRESQGDRKGVLWVFCGGFLNSNGLVSRLFRVNRAHFKRLPRKNFSRPLADEHACYGAYQSCYGAEDLAVPASEVYHVDYLQGYEANERVDREGYEVDYVLPWGEAPYPAS